MERKCFMGVARILLEELDLRAAALGWYKLFPPSSMVDPKAAPLMRHCSQLSLESTLGPCCERPETPRTHAPLLRLMLRPHSESLSCTCSPGSSRRRPGPGPDGGLTPRPL